MGGAPPFSGRAETTTTSARSLPASLPFCFLIVRCGSSVRVSCYQRPHFWPPLCLVRKSRQCRAGCARRLQIHVWARQIRSKAGGSGGGNSRGNSRGKTGARERGEEALPMLGRRRARKRRRAAAARRARRRAATARKRRRTGRPAAPTVAAAPRPPATVVARVAARREITSKGGRGDMAPVAKKKRVVCRKRFFLSRSGDGRPFFFVFIFRQETRAHAPSISCNNITAQRTRRGCSWRRRCTSLVFDLGARGLSLARVSSTGDGGRCSRRSDKRRARARRP